MAPEVLRQSPAFAHYKAAEQRQVLQRQYAAFLARERLNPAQAEQLLDFMVDLRLVPLDYLNSVEALGVSHPTGTGGVSAIQALQKPIYDEIKHLLGEARYDAFQSYTGSLTEREALETMTQSLKYSEHPLSDSQFDLLVGALAALKAEVRAANDGNMPLSEPAAVLEARYRSVMERSASSLKREQLEALEKIFAEDVAIRRRQQAIRAP